MKKIQLLFPFFMLFAGISFAQKKEFKTIFIADRFVQIDVPVSFGEPKKIQNAPGEQNQGTEDWIFIDKNNLTRLTYQYTSDTAAMIITDNDIPQWTDKQMDVLKLNKHYTYLDDGIFLQDGKNIGYIKYSFTQENIPGSFEMIFFASLNNRLIQFFFSCPLKLRKKWEPVADKIANSIRIIEKN